MARVLFLILLLLAPTAHPPVMASMSPAPGASESVACCPLCTCGDVCPCVERTDGPKPEPEAPPVPTTPRDEVRALLGTLELGSVETEATRTSASPAVTAGCAPASLGVRTQILHGVWRT